MNFDEETTHPMAAAEKKLELAKRALAQKEEEKKAALQNVLDHKEALAVANQLMQQAIDEGNDQIKQSAQEGLAVAKKLLDLFFTEAANAQAGVKLAQDEVHLRRDQVAALNNTMIMQRDRHQIDQIVAASPVNKFLADSIRYAQSAAISFWDFEAPREKTQADRVALREAAARHYQVWKNDGSCLCQVSRVRGNNNQVATSHLLKHATKTHMREVLEFEDINDMRNILLLSKGIDKAFEKGRIYFEFEAERSFKMKVWDSSVVSELIFDGAHPDQTIGKYVGKYLRIPRDVEPPFKRVLSDHAQASFNHALNAGWIPENHPAPTEYGSPLQNNILSFLRDDDQGRTEATDRTTGTPPQPDGGRDEPQERSTDTNE